VPLPAMTWPSVLFSCAYNRKNPPALDKGPVNYMIIEMDNLQSHGLEQVNRGHDVYIYLYPFSFSTTHHFPIYFYRVRAHDKFPSVCHLQSAGSGLWTLGGDPVSRFVGSCMQTAGLVRDRA
jgi:hypothetical protein